MRVLLVAASTEGFRDPAANAVRTRAVIDAVDRAPSGVKLVLVPAGYWTAPREGALDEVMADLVAGLSNVVAPRGIAIIGGVDAIPEQKSKQRSGLVRRHQLPFWGFAITATGKLAGPWRQVSTTRGTSGLASLHDVQKVPDRVLNVSGRRVLPLVCGEMHSERVREQAMAARVDIVVVCGHASLGQGLTPSLKSMNVMVGGPVLHVQHLAPQTGASFHWVKPGGNPGTVRVSTTGKDFGYPGFWLSSLPVSV